MKDPSSLGKEGIIQIFILSSVAARKVDAVAVVLMRVVVVSYHVAEVFLPTIDVEEAPPPPATAAALTTANTQPLMVTTISSMHQIHINRSFPPWVVAEIGKGNSYRKQKCKQLIYFLI